MAEDRKLTVGVPTETFPGEARVALVPGVLQALSKAGIDAIVQTGAGVAAGFPDSEYEAKGAKIGTREDAFGADIVVQVQTFGANILPGLNRPSGSSADLIALIGRHQPSLVTRVFAIARILVLVVPIDALDGSTASASVLFRLDHHASFQITRVFVITCVLITIVIVSLLIDVSGSFRLETFEKAGIKGFKNTPKRAFCRARDDSRPESFLGWPVRR